LIIYAAVIPAGVLILWIIAFQPSVHKAHVTVLGLGISIILTSFITDVLKDAIGRPRPDLIARCSPEISTPTDSLVTIEICTEMQRHLLHDGWRSFPSGHSSFSFAGLGYLAMFFASQTRALRPRASLLVAMLCIAPLLGAALIAISRLEDYRHDHADVICGSLLGFLVAYFNWRRYYPSLLSRACAEPYTPPSSGRGSPNGGAFQRVRDEEEGYGSTEAGRFSIGGDDGEGVYRDGR
jgi:diacylglycerol diphosphate phosphatase / phosphatidate phosphatase